MKEYKGKRVDSVMQGGMFINVFGTTITDMRKQDEFMAKVSGRDLPIGDGYTVNLGGDECYASTFEEAYEMAKEAQQC